MGIFPLKKCEYHYQGSFRSFSVLRYKHFFYRRMEKNEISLFCFFYLSRVCKISKAIKTSFLPWQLGVLFHDGKIEMRGLSSEDDIWRSRDKYDYLEIKATLAFSFDF